MFLKIPACRRIALVLALTCPVFASLGCHRAIAQDEAKPSSTKTTGSFRLSADEMRIPNSPLSGTIAGETFRLDQAKFEDGELILQQGEGIIPDATVKLRLFYNVTVPSDPVGKKWLATGDYMSDQPSVYFRARRVVDGRRKLVSKTVTGKFALKLELGNVTDAGVMPGRIFLKVPGDPGVDLVGTFDAELITDFRQPPRRHERPWVLSRIKFASQRTRFLTAGYIGRTVNGEWQNGVAGTTFAPGQFVGFTSHAPNDELRRSWITRTRQLGITGRHVHLEPGTYLFYAEERPSLESKTKFVAWQFVDVKPESQIELQFNVDSSKAGRLVVEIPRGSNETSAEIMPLDEKGQPAVVLERPNVAPRFTTAFPSAKVRNGKAAFRLLAPGRYRVFVGDDSVDALVKPGETTSVRLSDND